MLLKVMTYVPPLQICIAMHTTYYEVNCAFQIYLNELLNVLALVNVPMYLMQCDFFKLNCVAVCLILINLLRMECFCRPMSTKQYCFIK